MHPQASLTCPQAGLTYPQADLIHSQADLTHPQADLAEPQADPGAFNLLTTSICPIEVARGLSDGIDEVQSLFRQLGNRKTAINR